MAEKEIVNREITNQNLHLLLPGKVTLFAKIYAEEKVGRCSMPSVFFINRILTRSWKERRLSYGIMDRWLSMRNLKRSIEVNLQGYKKEKGSCLTATSFFRLVRDQVICTRENFSCYFATAMDKITNRSSICFRPIARMCGTIRNF